jgi:hypothetical protein
MCGSAPDGRAVLLIIQCLHFHIHLSEVAGGKLGSYISFDHSDVKMFNIDWMTTSGCYECVDCSDDKVRSVIIESN